MARAHHPGELPCPTAPFDDITSTWAALCWVLGWSLVLLLVTAIGGIAAGYLSRLFPHL